MLFLLGKKKWISFDSCPLFLPRVSGQLFKSKGTTRNT